MQLLDSLQHQPPSKAEPLFAALEDIASKVQIQPDFCIHHPDYQPMELAAEIVDRFQKLPSALQNKYRSLQLQSFLYGTYYNGSLQEALAVGSDADEPALPPNLENNTFMGVDLAFYERLHESNCGTGYFDPGWLVLRQESDGSLAVSKNGLTLHIDRERHLHPEAQSANINDVVAIKLPRNRVQSGFYMAIGDVGANNRSEPKQRSETVRIYFNLSPDGAVAVMSSLSQQLNDLSLPFSFKALYNPSTYGRHDSAVLYFEKSHYDSVRPVLEAVYAEHQSHFQPQVPLFTKQMAAGLGLAEEPSHKFADLESFGMNRCLIVANALLESWQQGDDSIEGRMNRILSHFSAIGLDVQRPYLNANSEDIYTSLNL